MAIRCLSLTIMTVIVVLRVHANTGFPNAAGPKPVATLDVPMYLGRWYQVVHVPLRPTEWCSGACRCTPV